MNDRSSTKGERSYVEMTLNAQFNNKNAVPGGNDMLLIIEIGQSM